MNEYLNDALGEISDDKIAEAAKGKKTNRAAVLKGLCAACLVFAVAAAAAFVKTDKRIAKDEPDPAPTKAAAQAVTEAGEEDPIVPTKEAEIFQEKKWNEKENNEKYTEVSFNGSLYLPTGVTAEKAEVGAALGRAEAKGFDIYDCKSYETDCEVYTAGAFPSEFLIAVKFTSDDRYYTYKADNRFVSDLKDFSDTLNFSETIQFGREVILSVQPYADSDKIKLNENTQLFEQVYQILENNGSAKALEYTAENEPKDGARILEFSVSSPLFGRYSRFLTVSEDGYLITNLVEAGVSFYVGEDAVKALFETADKSGGEKYVPTTTPPYPTENEQSPDSQTSCCVSPGIQTEAPDTADGIDVTEIYSQGIEQEE